MIKKILSLFVFLALASQAVSAAQVPGTASAGSQKESFGSYLFNGNFGNNKKESFNESYRINNKDVLNLIVWGAVSMEHSLSVDLKGNVFIPDIGVINVKGKTIKQVNDILQARIKGIYKENVFHYITIKNYQKINVIVSGEVDNPGIYEGYPTDLVVEYIGQAGGITDNGSYRHIVVKRSNKKKTEIDLYDFIREGSIENFQFQEGDVVFIPKKKRYLFVKGEASFNGAFEIKDTSVTIAQLQNYITPNRLVNEYTLTYREGNREIQRVHDLAENKTLRSRNTVDFKTNLVKSNITVYLRGEHESQEEYVVARGTSLEDFLLDVRMSKRSDFSDIRLYRESVKRQQRDMIDNQVKSMKRTLFQVKSRTVEEETIRTSEVKRIQGFIEEAAALEPKGQMVIAGSQLYGDVFLEDGDIIEVPTNNNLITIYGEVMFPNTFVIDAGASVGDVIKMAGGFTSNADEDKLFIIKSNGAVEMDVSKRTEVVSGDKVVILQEIDGKFFQLFKDLTQTVYQIALSTGVVLSI